MILGQSHNASMLIHLFSWRCITVYAFVRSLLNSFSGYIPRISNTLLRTRDTRVWGVNLVV